MLLFSSLTPTAINYNPNISATMQQPSSVVATRKLQDRQPLNTQRRDRKNTGVQFKVLAGN